MISRPVLLAWYRSYGRNPVDDRVPVPHGIQLGGKNKKKKIETRKRKNTTR